MSNLVLIVSIVRKGWGSTVLEASVNAGARGGTVLFGRGAGIHEREKIFGMSIEPEKEVLLTIVNVSQVDAILELQLYRLTQLSVDEILNELAEIRKRIAEYEEILASDKKLRAVIIKELEEVRDKYGDARRTQIIDESAEIQLEDLIADEQVAVTVSHQGYLKRTPISVYRQQRRGGTGRMGMKTREEDFVAQLEYQVKACLVTVQATRAGMKAAGGGSVINVLSQVTGGVPPPPR